MLRLKFVCTGEEEPINNLIDELLRLWKDGSIKLVEFNVSGGSK